jgi:RimJ/RimL family protein N-acetyltransferase
MAITLVPMTEAHIEWIREQRNRPELMRFFRQDQPITKEQQIKWWRGLDKNRVRLFVVQEDGKNVAYCGLNPFNGYALSAEFGVFVIPEAQKKGLGTQAMKLLMSKVFTEMNLSTLYSDTLMYPGEEKRWQWFQSLGFLPYAEACQNIRYKKQGKWVPSKKFYMTKDRYMELHGQNRAGSLGAAVRGAVTSIVQKAQGKG